MGGFLLIMEWRLVTGSTVTPTRSAIGLSRPVGV
jgi:hypothetical protein